jgi:hypothetical protein
MFTWNVSKFRTGSNKMTTQSVPRTYMLMFIKTVMMKIIIQYFFNLYNLNKFYYSFVNMLMKNLQNGEVKFYEKCMVKNSLFSLLCELPILCIKILLYFKQ